jgi:aspartate-semialdehyde dehydrogenase
MIEETRKILHAPELRVTATTVRVPVRFAHSVSVNLELEKDFLFEDVKRILSEFPGIIVKDDPDHKL